MDFRLIFSKRASDGRTVEVFGGEYLGEAIIRKVTLGGERIERPSSNVYSLPKPQGAATHYIAGKPPIGLTSDEANLIIAALASLQAEIDAAKPPAASASSNLRREREDLILAHRGLLDEQAYQFERAHDRQDANAWHIKASYEPQIERAAQAVRDFDAAHPDVLAAIEAERAEAVERNRWM